MRSSGRTNLRQFWRSLEIMAIGNGGERMTHLYPNDCYYAHLSLYRFAATLARDKRVLDAGSGAGYGAAYLATHGARRVLGLDISAEGIAFSQHHFRHPNLTFSRRDVQALPGIQPKSVDLLVCSNVLEHLPSVPDFLRAAHDALATDGALLVAVPPVIHDYSRAENLANPHHLNVWSPAQWVATFGRYFDDLQCYQHIGTRPEVALNFANRPRETVVTEDDFAFLPVTLDEWLAAPTMTFVLLARTPRAHAYLPAPDAPPNFVDDSVTKPPPPRRTHGAALREQALGVLAPPPGRRWQLWTVAMRGAAALRAEGVRALIRKVGTSRRRYRPT